jgi:beta-aspartyl-peptidase (threonine type)
MDATGGVIAIDAEGRVAMPFNTPGMFRGTVDAEGNVTVEIYSD